MANKATMPYQSYVVSMVLPLEARPTVKFGNYDRIRNFVVLLSLLNIYSIIKKSGHSVKFYNTIIIITLNII